ncbi:hypothetical protein HKX48_004026 [Thoreauomyces humboldtii]|nr:hypothetical protein HKX48_004026 [Thoreauomyces humboldtii]
MKAVSRAIDSGRDTVNQHVPGTVKVGKATIHSPIADTLGGDLIKATSILEHFIKGTNQMDSALIPPRVIANAKGVAVITILKAGFLWSGRAGSGIVVAKLPDGSWSAPSAIAAAGAGFGAQIGAQLTDCVFILVSIETDLNGGICPAIMLFRHAPQTPASLCSQNNDAAVKAFSHGGNLTFGGNMSVAAGPKGRSAEAAGAVVNFAPIYSYSKSKGLFAGVSLEGSVIVTRNDANREMYGRKVSPKDILTGEVMPPVQADALYRVLDLKFGNMGTGVKVLSAYSERMGNSRASSAPVSRKGTAANKIGAAPVGSGSAGDLGRNASSATTTKMPPPPLPNKPKGSAGAAKEATAIALYDFVGERESDLSFKKGDTITVIKSGSPADWWSGSVGGRTGEFPGNYVE